MQDFICANCYTLLSADLNTCPGCSNNIIADGKDKNIIDHIEPNCLIHRYDGSDMLEPAVIIKSCKTNIKAATKLKEYAEPITIPKSKVYKFDQKLLISIQALRNERTATMRRFEQQIQNCWQNLKLYSD